MIRTLPPRQTAFGQKVLILMVALATRATHGDPAAAALERQKADSRFDEFERLDLGHMPAGDVLAKHGVAAIPWRKVSGPSVNATRTGERKRDTAT